MTNFVSPHLAEIGSRQSWPAARWGGGAAGNAVGRRGGDGGGAGDARTTGLSPGSNRELLSGVAVG